LPLINSNRTMSRRVKVAGDLFHRQVPDGAICVGLAAPGLLLVGLVMSRRFTAWSRQLGSSSIDGSRRWLLPNLAPLTHATYESHVKNYIEPGIGAQRLDRLRVADVQAWLNRLAAECQCCVLYFAAVLAAGRLRSVPEYVSDQAL
jgi:hypothetical protein